MLQNIQHKHDQIMSVLLDYLVLNLQNLVQYLHPILEHQRIIAVLNVTDRLDEFDILLDQIQILTSD